MKRICLLIIMLLLITPSSVYAKPGCCSGKGGVAYCGQSGHYVCNNGELSPSCQCDEADYTTYDEDKANGELYYGEDEDYADEEDGENLGIVDQNGNVSYLDDEDLEQDDTENEENNTSDYFWITTLLTTVAVGSYATGKAVGKNKLYK